MKTSSLARRIYFNHSPEALAFIKYKEQHPGFEYDLDDKFKLSLQKDKDNFIYILKGMKEDFEKSSAPVFLFYKCKKKVHDKIWIPLSVLYAFFQRMK